VKYNAVRALELLRVGSGIPRATFRAEQEEAIQHVVEGRGRLLVVQKTGWGKSFVYFIAVKLLRESGLGPALLVSPLLSLMRNQIAAAERMGVRALTIHSDNKEQWEDVESGLERDDADILLISPERLANEHFRDEVLSHIAARISMLVIDEAHCISDWGHDFRPHYRLIERIARTLPPTLRLLATTATANNRLMQDITSVFGQDLTILRGDLNRPSLYLQTIRLPNQAERLAWLATHVTRLPGSGIIYTLTVRDTALVTQWLQSRGLHVEAYTGQSGEQRPALEEALLANRIKALVATTALGMGFDKPDLAFVIHYQSPGSVVAYYQQVGRAGRALEAAYGILLSGDEEDEINDYFIRSAFPTRDEVRSILDALEIEPEGLSVPGLLGKINMSYGRVEKAIALLSLESPAPIAKQGTKWQLTAAGLSETFWERAERLTALRHIEKEQMKAYVELSSGHMEFLVRALDGKVDAVTTPSLTPLPAEADPGLVRAAAAFLRRTHLPITTRDKWPSGGMPQYALKGGIPAELRARPGMALCRWGDAGWGTLVRKGKYVDSWFSDELAGALAEMLKSWRPEPAPTWVTCVPSLRHSALVPGLAQRVASLLGLPFYQALQRTDDRAEQKTMTNNVQQARNLDGAFCVSLESLPDGPVFLVDDMVDSRWTFTVTAWLLCAHGCPGVYPVALADAGYAK